MGINGKSIFANRFERMFSTKNDEEGDGGSRSEGEEDLNLKIKVEETPKKKVGRKKKV